jgi:hypothetical protein
MLPCDMSLTDGLQRGLLQREAIRFSLEPRSKSLLTFGRRFRRILQHLPRMAQELPIEWGQRVAANTRAVAPRLGRTRPSDIASVTGTEEVMTMPRVKAMLSVLCGSWRYAALRMMMQTIEAGV